MGGFGEDLRKAREARGVALQEIANATKIVSRHLEAVEQERFDQLPKGLFRKNIVRSYARAAGLDENAWVERFLAITEPPPAPNAFQTEDRTWTEFAANVGRARGKDPSSEPKASRWAGVAVLLLLVGGFGWLVWNYAHAKATAGQVVSYGQTLSQVQ